ncbi:hypothetical protein [Streptomyces longispororuber]|uniref:hypothetical protein n=1 Tax=Streptomyces longispororuber TaxID=68230 RepID=UPI00167DA83B
MNELLARLDQSAGWCGVFWSRDPDGMRACLDGAEVPPWDVVQALLHDLAADAGVGVAEAETGRARALHAASVAAHDDRPGGRELLSDRLDMMLQEQRFAQEREQELARSLAVAATPEEVDRIRLDMAWVRDDHERAAARCGELRERMERLDRARAPRWVDFGGPPAATPELPAAAGETPPVVLPADETPADGFRAGAHARAYGRTYDADGGDADTDGGGANAYGAVGADGGVFGADVDGDMFGAAPDALGVDVGAVGADTDVRATDGGVSGTGADVTGTDVTGTDVDAFGRGGGAYGAAGARPDGYGGGEGARPGPEAYGGDGAGPGPYGGGDGTRPGLEAYGGAGTRPALHTPGGTRPALHTPDAYGTGTDTGTGTGTGPPSTQHPDTPGRPAADAAAYDLPGHEPAHGHPQAPESRPDTGQDTAEGPGRAPAPGPAPASAEVSARVPEQPTRSRLGIRRRPRGGR